jgi:hypothetical protein
MQHQNPEFSHTQGEIFKKPAKKYISIQGAAETQKTVNFCGKLSFILSFLSGKGLYCTTTTIGLEPCALNAEFQHFILRFNKISLLCQYHLKRG